MSTVRVTCPLCEHPVEVPASEVIVHLAGSARDATDQYSFSCPTCAVYVVRPAGPAVVQALLATDVQAATGPVPPWDTGEAGERPGIVLVDACSHGEHRTRVVAPPGAQNGDAPPGARNGDAPPITEADVLLFRKALADDAILAAWLAG